MMADNYYVVRNSTQLNKFAIATLILFTSLTSQTLGQTIPGNPPRTASTGQAVESTRIWNLMTLRGNAGVIRETNFPRVGIRTGITSASPVEDAARKKLGPTKEERREYKDFLSQSKSGLFRIASSTACRPGARISSSEGKCLNLVLPGIGIAYSFRSAGHTYDQYSDLRRYEDEFVLPGTFVLGMIASLGDQPIQSLTKESDLVKDIAGFTAATDVENVARQDKELLAGIQIGSLSYKKSTPIIEDTTYILRSVAYRVKLVNLPKGERSASPIINEDKRHDVIVIFRIVKKDPDGGILLLWRELFRKQAPQLEVNAQS